MALFEPTKEGETLQFPTEPAYLIPITIKETNHYGHGHKGVFAAAFVPANTKLWAWTDRVTSIHYSELNDYIHKHFTTDDEIRLFLRQGFVLPGEKSEYFNSNPTDAGRFTNHSNEPNMGPDGALRDIEEGEELTMDYSFHGNPTWYQDICRRYGALTEAEVAKMCKMKEKK